MGEEEEGTVGTKIKIGVCVMEKKVKCGSEVYSAPMEQILERLEAFGEFEIIIFGDRTILEDPVESWPICNCLIAFYSSGYPLEKAEAYAALRKPFLVNELEQQHLLHDRRKVYECLEMYGIPVPRYALVNRDFPYEELDYFVEQEDFVEVHGNRFWKPFVEKPIDGDDHSIMIYYPSSAGGGMKELFRKVGNRSSEFHPEVRRVRREGSYIYEEFMHTGGTDVKVYTVGPEYAHAEARKSPVVDGVVMRNPDGKESREEWKRRRKDNHRPLRRPQTIISCSMEVFVQVSVQELMEQDQLNSSQGMVEGIFLILSPDMRWDSFDQSRKLLQSPVLL